MPENTSDIEQHIERYRKLLERDPNSRVFAPLAEACRKADRLQEALAIAASGVQRHPTYASGRVALARAQLALERYEDAAGELAEALAHAPENALAHRLLGEARARLGDRAGAFDAFARALALNPEDEEARDALAGFEAAPEPVSAPAPDEASPGAEPIDASLTQPPDEDLEPAIAEPEPPQAVSPVEFEQAIGGEPPADGVRPLSEETGASGGSDARGGVGLPEEVDGRGGVPPQEEMPSMDLPAAQEDFEAPGIAEGIEGIAAAGESPELELDLEPVALPSDETARAETDLAGAADVTDFGPAEIPDAWRPIEEPAPQVSPESAGEEGSRPEPGGSADGMPFTGGVAPEDLSFEMGLPDALDIAASSLAPEAREALPEPASDPEAGRPAAEPTEEALPLDRRVEELADQYLRLGFPDRARALYNSLLAGNPMNLHAKRKLREMGPETKAAARAPAAGNQEVRRKVEENIDVLNRWLANIKKGAAR